MVGTVDAVGVAVADVAGSDDDCVLCSAAWPLEPPPLSSKTPSSMPKTSPAAAAAPSANKILRSRQSIGRFSLPSGPAVTRCWANGPGACVALRLMPAGCDYGPARELL